MDDSYGYAVPYPGNDEDSEASDSSNVGTYSPGRIILEGNGGSAMKNCLVPSTDSSLPELNIASPESSCSLELGRPSVLSSSSLSSGPRSARSENASDDVPYELSALSQTRHTPPPRFTQFNFRKRRSRGTPKNSPKVNMLSIKEVFRKTPDDKPPKKVAKLVGTDDLDTEVGNKRDERAAMEMATTESQTDAEYVEDQGTVNLMPQNIIIKAFARSKSEPCLTTSKKSVSFMTKDNYISDSEEVNGMSTPISEGAKKRMSRARRRFPSKGMIDASKITDSLKLLRMRLGSDPEGTGAEGTEHYVGLSNDVEVKTKHRTLATIKNKIIRKISLSPAKGSKVTGEQMAVPVTTLSNANIGDTGIRVTEDNCSTTALRGSPLSTRSSSIQEIEEADVSSKSTSHLLTIAAETTEFAAKPNQNTSSVQKFFSFRLGRKKLQKNKVQVVTKINDDHIEQLNACVESDIPEKRPQQSYFQILDNMGKMSPAIRNIGNKYKLFPKNSDDSITTDQEKDGASNTSCPKNTEMAQYSTKCEVQLKNGGNTDENQMESTLHPVSSDFDAHQHVDEEFDTEFESREISGTYAPNEGDQNKPLIKRTKKSTNVAINTKELDVRKPNSKKPSPHKKPLKKTKSITQRLRRFWSSRDKVTTSEDGLEMEEVKSSESLEESKNETGYRHTGEGKRGKLMTHSDTSTAQMGDNHIFTERNEMATSKSAGDLVYPLSTESSTSEEINQLNIQPSHSPRNMNQNCENSQLDAIFKLQNFVHSFTQSESDVSFRLDLTSPRNTEPTIRRKDITGQIVKLSTSSSRSTPEPFLENEDANLEFPILNYKKRTTTGSDNKVEHTEMDVADEDERRLDVNGDVKNRKPRRIQPVRVQHESMQTDPVDTENDEVFEAFKPSCEALSVREPTTIAMHCQIQQQNENVFHPYDLNDDSQTVKHKFEGEGSRILNKPKYRDQLGSMEMDTTSDVDNKANRIEENKENESAMKKRARWVRYNSAPAFEEKKPTGLPRVNTTPLHVRDSSLDKWDMMKLILEETQAIYLAEFGNLDLESPPNAPLSAQQTQRPFDYDESLSAGSSASTDSASETKDMETGDLEENDIVHHQVSGSNVYPSRMDSHFEDKGFGTTSSDAYINAPVPSPVNPQEVQPVITEISLSSLSSSLSRMEAFGEKGGSGEKRKQSEVTTPTKDEQPGRKVRLESPESDEEGPPRARRVLRQEKL